MGIVTDVFLPLALAFIMFSLGQGEYNIRINLNKCKYFNIFTNTKKAVYWKNCAQHYILEVLCSPSVWKNEKSLFLNNKTFRIFLWGILTFFLRRCLSGCLWWYMESAKFKIGMCFDYQLLFKKIWRIYHMNSPKTTWTLLAHFH